MALTVARSNRSRIPSFRRRAPPAPMPKRNRAPPPPPPSLPQCKAVYAYDAADTDELSFTADAIIEIVKKGTPLLSIESIRTRP